MALTSRLKSRNSNLKTKAEEVTVDNVKIEADDIKSTEILSSEEVNGPIHPPRNDDPTLGTGEIKVANIDFSRDGLTMNMMELDTDLRKLPALIHDYTIALIRAEYERDSLKKNLLIAEARLDSEIRNNPEDHGIVGKPTENAVRAAITTNESIIQLEEELNQKNSSCKTILAAVDRLKNKYKTLEWLARLYLGSYNTEKNMFNVDIAGNENQVELSEESISRLKK